MLLDYNEPTRVSGQLIRLREDATKYQAAVLKTFDSDGFTLTWTKTGTPSAGTGQVYYTALR